MKNPILTFCICLFYIVSITAQTKQLTIYVFEKYNRGFVENARIQLMDSLSGILVANETTNAEGLANFKVKLLTTYILKISKNDFVDKQISITIENDTLQKQYIKLPLEREAGYIFDVTLAAEKGSTQITALGLSGVQIEVYNRTTKKVELELKSHPQPNFQFTVKTGNHYTMLLRKEGYVAKRIEIYVNVEGCILCIDGIDEVQPGVTDNISETGLGSLLANIELKKAAVGKTFQIRNINYDFDKFNIRPDAAKILNYAVNVFIDNPEFDLELGSHTDARGEVDYNLTLSNNRALAAMNYLISRGVDSNRISYKGYGESQIINHCKDDVECSDTDHEVNRRTELKITGIRKSETESWYSLQRIITEEEFSKEMFQSSEPEQIPIKANVHTHEKSTSTLDINHLKGKYYISIGEFKTEELAMNRVKQLSILGVNFSQVVFQSKKNIYVVIAGKTDNKNDAQSIVDELMKKNVYSEITEKD